MYQTVVSILRSEYNWPTDCAPAPEATAKALETSLPSDVAESLDGWVDNVVYGSDPPYGIVGNAAYRRWVIHRTFAIGREMWEISTAVALGLAVDPPLDKIAEARSVSEWLRNQSLRRSRLGYLLVDYTPEGDAEMARRQAKAQDVPLEWSEHATIWALAVVDGMIPVTLDALSAAYAASTPSLDSVRKLDAQMWMDVLRCDDKGKPRKWNADGSLNPKFVGF